MTSLRLAFPYSSGPRFRDLSSVFRPLRARVLGLHVGSLKSLLDFSQAEATHCRRLYVFPLETEPHNDKKQILGHGQQLKKNRTFLWLPNSERRRMLTSHKEKKKTLYEKQQCNREGDLKQTEIYIK